MLHKTRPNEKFLLHLKKAGKKAGLANRNIVHGEKKNILRCVGFCPCINILDYSSERLIDHR